jgi:hypothetical protein
VNICHILFQMLPGGSVSCSLHAHLLNHEIVETETKIPYDAKGDVKGRD